MTEPTEDLLREGIPSPALHSDHCRCATCESRAAKCRRCGARLFTSGPLCEKCLADPGFDPEPLTKAVQFIVSRAVQEQKERDAKIAERHAVRLAPLCGYTPLEIAKEIRGGA